MDKRVLKSKADVVILGGDFNAGRLEHEGLQLIFDQVIIPVLQIGKTFGYYI